MAIQVRRGNEADFDPSKMLPGEWAVSTDTKYVRMCFSPGIVLRMATYESFENDVKKIQQILEDAENIKNAIKVIQDEINAKEIVVENYSKQASSFAAQSKKYSEESEEYSIDSYEQAERAKMYADNAQAVTNVSIATKNIAGIVRGGDNLIGEDGELILTRTTTDRTLSHSHAGGLRIESVEGESVQESTTGTNMFDYDTAFSDKSGVEVNNGIITSNTTSDATVWTYANSNLKSTLAAGTYYLRLNKISAEITSSMGVRVFDENNNSLLSAYGNNMFSELSFTLDTEMNIGIMIKPYVSSFTIQLNTAPSLPWEPYTGAAPSPSPSYPQEIESSVVSEIKVVGKNLFNALNYTAFYAGCIPEISEGTIKLTAKGTVADFYSGYVTSYKVEDMQIPVTPNTTYYFNCDKLYSNTSNLKEFRVMVGYFDKNNKNLGRATITTDFTTPDNCDYVVLRFGAIQNVATADEYAVFSNIILSKIDTDYEPYKAKAITLSTPITLHGRGEAKDRIVKQDGVWGVERKPQYDVYTSISSIVNGLAQIIVPSNHFESLSWDKVPNALCNMFKAVSCNDNKAGIEGFSTKSTSDANNWAYTFFIPSIEQTVEAYNAFLAEKPIEFVSVKGESTFEPLPEADQIALNSLVTYDEVTHISTDSTIGPVVTVTYGTSKVGAEGILNANALEISELEKAELLKEIEQLKNNNNIITYSSLEEIPDYTDGIGWEDVIEILPPNSMVQTGYVVTKYPNLFDNAPDVVKLCTGILFINKAHDYSNYLIKVYDADLQKIYLRGAYPAWTEISGNEIT